MGDGPDPPICQAGESGRVLALTCYRWILSRMVVQFFVDTTMSRLDLLFILGNRLGDVPITVDLKPEQPSRETRGGLAYDCVMS